MKGQLNNTQTARRHAVHTTHKRPDHTQYTQHTNSQTTHSTHNTQTARPHAVHTTHKQPDHTQYTQHTNSQTTRSTHNTQTARTHAVHTSFHVININWILVSNEPKIVQKISLQLSIDTGKNKVKSFYNNFCELYVNLISTHILAQVHFSKNMIH